MVDRGEGRKQTVIWLDPKGSLDDARTGIRYAQLVRKYEMAHKFLERVLHWGNILRRDLIQCGSGSNQRTWPFLTAVVNERLPNLISCQTQDHS